MQFIADGMLGKLTRWLRMLGHDVDYYRDADDRNLLLLAETQKRVLLTRDAKLYQQAIRNGLDAVLVDASDDATRLACLAKRFGFDLVIDLSVSRCPKCNAVLLDASKEDILEKIPKATSIYYNDFWLCSGCGQVYWQGAHWKRIQTTLEEAKNKLNLL